MCGLIGQPTTHPHPVRRVWREVARQQVRLHRHRVLGVRRRLGRPGWSASENRIADGVADRVPARCGSSGAIYAVTRGLAGRGRGQLHASADRRPDGHFKFPHLWPLKLPQAGRSDYGFFLTLSELIARLRCRGLPERASVAGWPSAGRRPSRGVGSPSSIGCSGKRSASGRRHRPGSGGQATDHAGAVHRLVLWAGGLPTAGASCLGSIGVCRA